MMPYRADRNWLFIHIPKNAGRSIENALGFVTPRENERYRWRSTVNRALTWAQRLTGDQVARQRLWGVYDHSVMLQHLTYAETSLMGLIERGALNEAVKFAVVRNPYDRAVSLYCHLAPGAPRSSEAFTRFLQRWLTFEEPRHGLRAFQRPQWQYCVDLEGGRALDAILRYESLEQDFLQFATRYLGASVELPWVGRGRHERGYRDWYSETARSLVTDAYARDCEMFGYEF